MEHGTWNMGRRIPYEKNWQPNMVVEGELYEVIRTHGST